MSDESELNVPDEVAQKPMISLPFIIVAGIIAIGGALGGKPLMTWFMLQGESAKANTIEEPETFAPLSAWAQSMKEDPDEVWTGGDIQGGDGGEGGGFDAEAKFAEWDADSDEALNDEEMPKFLKDNLEAIDSNTDGNVSKDEFMAAVAAMAEARSGGSGTRQRPAAEEPEEPAAEEPANEEPAKEEPAAKQPAAEEPAAEEPPAEEGDK
ncbi:MAG: hypothetical protein AAF483_18285 [Planctomycetota bacterium]